MKASALVILLASCAESPTPPPIARVSHDLRYGVFEVPSGLGGTNSRADSIADDGSIAGFSNLPDNATRHATLWQSGRLTDLGTLGGPNSSVVWPGQNDRHWVVGIAETTDTDPNTEDWSCSAFFPGVTHHVCRGFVWRDSAMTAMPTFGGTHSFATGVNDHGHVVGWAETTVHDASCTAPQVLQFRAAEWDPRSGAFTQLVPLGTDATSAATAINEAGVAVGISGACDLAVGRFSAAHAVRWDHGVPADLGSLGGVSWTTPMAINDRGDIVGFSNLAGDADGTFNPHAVLWPRHHAIIDLGVLPGDAYSEALGINSRGQVVGLSCAATCRAFVWQDGTMTDLNTIVGPGFPDTLTSAQDIDDAGTIAGRVKETSSGRTLPFVATPVD